MQQEAVTELSHEQQQEAKRYQKQKLTVTSISIVVELAYLLIMAFWGGLALDKAIAPAVAGHRWLHLWLFALCFALGSQLISYPLDFFGGYVLEHRYGLSNESFAGWFTKQSKILGLLLVIGGVLLTGFYAILWSIPNWWWIAASIGWISFTVVLGQLFPVLIVPLFYKLTPIDDQALLGRFRAWADGTGIQIKDILRLGLSRETRKANAALAGLGPTKRVMMGDTLLDNFSTEEIDAVFVHELGHSVHHHVPKGIVLTAILGTAGFYLCDVVARRLAILAGHDSFTAVSALPLLLLVLSVFALILNPVEKAISRHFEREADWYSLSRTKNAEAFVSAFRRLAELNKADIDPSRLTVLLFYTHPPISERMEMARRWASQK